MTDLTGVSLNEFYSMVLSSSMQADGGDGYIVQAPKVGHPTDTKITVRDRLLVMPLNSFLKNPNEKEIFFHPLSEQITRGQSTIFKHIRRMGTLSLCSTITNLGFALLKLQEHPEVQRQMTVEQQNFMKGLIDTDKSSKEAWLNMAFLPIKEDPSRTDKWLLNIFIKNNGQFEGKNFRRVGVLNFPVFEHIQSGKKFTKGEGASEKTVGRAKDYLMFQQMANTLFPNWDTTEEYNSGYDGATGSNLVTFLRTYYRIGKRLNDIIDMFQVPFESVQVFTDVNSFRVSLDWSELVLTEEGIEALTQLARRVPGLKGNIGDVNGVEDIDEEDESIRERESKPKPFTATSSGSISVKTEVKPKVEEAKKDDSGLTPEHIRLRDEAIARREKYLADEAEWAKRKSERDQGRGRDRDDRDDRDDRRDDRRDYRDRDRDDRDRSRDRDDRDDRRDRDRDRDRDDRDSKPEVKADSSGRVSFSDIRKVNRSIGQDDDDRRDYRDRGGRDDRSYRGSRDDRSYRGSRDDRDYRGGRDDRDYRGSRYDRDDRRDDRSYRGSRYR